MSGDAEDDERPAASRDDEYIEGYSKGYGDGLREALRELRAHAARGASPQELRMLIESRLARIPDDVEVRRKGLLAPPRRAAWSSLLRGPAATTWSPPATPLPIAPIEPGTSLLVKEDRPERALAVLRASAPKFRRVFLVSRRPPTIGGEATARVESITPAGQVPVPGALDDSAFAGRINEAVHAGSVLTYLDALEYLATENGVERTIRLAGWLGHDAVENGSAVVVSLAPRTLQPRDVSRIEHAFHIVR